MRIAIGPRDLKNGTVELARRDTLSKDVVPIDGIIDRVKVTLDEIQTNLYDKAKNYRTENTRKADTWDEFKELIKKTGGFVQAHWDGTSETEEKIKEMTKATIRCIPLNNKKEDGKCILTGKPSEQRVLFAKAY